MKTTLNEAFVLNNVRQGYVTIDFVRGWRVRSYDIPYKRIERYCQITVLLSRLGFTITSMRALSKGKTFTEYLRKPAPTPAPMPTVTYNIMGTRSYPMPDNKSVLIVAVRGMGDYSWAAYMGLVDQDQGYDRIHQNEQIVAESGLKLYEWEARGIFEYERFADIPYRR